MDTVKTISDAEWQVMKIIWSDAPATSTHIIKELSKTKDWTPSTIKTLLGRLVNKKAIDFSKKNRTFYYLPIVTEEECIKEENRVYIEKVYGGKLNRETSHFIFYGENLETYINRLSESLESEYQRLLNNFEYDLPEKVTVFIHADIKRFHKAMGATNAPEWFRASYLGGILHIVPPEYFSDLPAEKMAVHVLAQIIIHRINYDVPMWLYQGVSAYEGKWLDKNWIKIVLANRISKEEIPSFTEMSIGFKKFGENDGYLLSFTIADFLINKYGYQKLNEFIRKPYDYQKIFGISENDLWLQWVEFLREYYK